MSMPMRTIVRSAGTRGATRTRSSRPCVYLSANPDVAAAGVDPLDHFDAAGWQEGRVPSINFDPAQYLAANPDVAAAQRRSAAALSSQFGDQEGRQPFAPTELIAANGFDYRLLPQPQSGRGGGGRRSVRSTSRPSAGRKGAIRTRCSTPTAISRPTRDVAAARRQSARPLQPVRLARRARSVGRLRHHRLSRGLSGRARPRTSTRSRTSSSSASTRAARPSRTACGGSNPGSAHRARVGRARLCPPADLARAPSARRDGGHKPARTLGKNSSRGANRNHMAAPLYGCDPPQQQRS